MPDRLMIITASTREGRQGPKVAAWITARVARDPSFEIDPVDLATAGLPFLDEPNHPRLRKYQHDHTKAWSARVDAADGFVLVTPEYNHGFPATIKNALDYLFWEWQRKPLGFVSYGGISGGLRGMQMLKPVLSGLKLIPLVEAVNLPFFNKHIGDDGTFVPPPEAEKSADAMLAELKTWLAPLREMRAAQVRAAAGTSP